MVNFYNVIPEEFLDKEVDYPNKSKLKCKLPAVWNISGPTGSGKSNSVLDLIKAYGCFQKIYLFVKSHDEPLYRWLIHQLREVERLHDVTILFLSNDLMDLPPLEEVDKDFNNLFIFDDMIGEKDKILTKMSNYAIAARKRNASCWFLSQNYFGTPGLFRKQQNYVILTGINTYEDLKRIMREMAISIPWEVLVEMFKEIQNLDTFEPKPLDDFFMIDNVLNNPLQKCRRRFEPMDPRPFFEKLGLPVPQIKDGQFTDEKKRKRTIDKDDDKPVKKPKRKTMDDHWKEEQKELKRSHETIHEVDNSSSSEPHPVSYITKSKMMVHRQSTLPHTEPEKVRKKRKLK